MLWNGTLAQGCLPWHHSAAPIQPCLCLAEDDTMDETAPEEVLLDGNAEARASDFYMPSGVEVRGGPWEPWAGTRRLPNPACVALCWASQLMSFVCGHILTCTTSSPMEPHAVRKA